MKPYLFALAASGVAFAGDPLPPSLPPAPPPPPGATSSSGGGLFDFVGGELALGYQTDHMRDGHYLGRNWIGTDLDFAIPLTEQLSLDFGGGYGTTVDDESIAWDDLDELTARAGLSYSAGPFQFYGGWRWYRYEFGGFGGTDYQENELYAGVNTTLLDGYLNLNSEYFYNLDEENWNSRTTVSSNLAVTESFSIIPSVTLGCIIDEGNQVWADNSGLGYLEARIAAPLRLTDYATITPWIGYTWVLNAIDDSAINSFGSSDDRLSGGVSLSVQF